MTKDLQMVLIEVRELSKKKQAEMERVRAIATQSESVSSTDVLQLIDIISQKVDVPK